MATIQKVKSWILVLVQFIALGWILFTGPLFAANRILLAVEVCGVGLGLWAVFAIGVGNFSITPNPLRGARLVTSGPYNMIRHPMYLALLLFTLPLVISEFSWLRFTVFLILLGDLLIKLYFEESMLIERLSGYKQYCQKTYRFIPFVY